MEFPRYSPPQTRSETFACARDFAPKMGAEYARRRNHVALGHPYVSQLSPAIRVRLMLENELSRLAVEEFGALPPCEKFVREVGWRSYWRSWLELRPQIWNDYNTQRESLRANLDSAKSAHLTRVENGESGVAVMDKFARELVETGYLHNHARMWFAAFWIHTLGLPWQLGADFFERNLICACPASNTLSWRWVAGVQTQGKAYLARRSNLEKYCDEFYLSDATGLEQLEKPQTAMVSIEPFPAPMNPSFETTLPARKKKVGMWISEDDLTPETSILRELEAMAIGISVGDAPQISSNGLRRKFRLNAARDCASRALDFWGVQPIVWADFSPQILLDWAQESGLETVVCLKPFVGVMGDLVPEIKSTLAQNNIGFHALRRSDDARLLGFAHAGFFRFWEGAKAELENKTHY